METAKVMSPAIASSMMTSGDPFSPPRTSGQGSMAAWRRQVAQWNELHTMTLSSTNEGRRRYALARNERAFHLKLSMTGIARARADLMSTAELMDDSDAVHNSLPSGLRKLLDIVDPPNVQAKAERRMTMLKDLFRLERKRDEKLSTYVARFDRTCCELIEEGFSVHLLDEILGLRLLDGARLSATIRAQLLFSSTQGIGGVCTYKSAQEALTHVRDTDVGQETTRTNVSSTQDGPAQDSARKPPCPACGSLTHWSAAYKGCPLRGKTIRIKKVGASQGTSNDPAILKAADVKHAASAAAPAHNRLLSTNTSRVEHVDHDNQESAPHRNTYLVLADSGAQKSTCGVEEARQLKLDVKKTMADDPQFHQFGCGPNAGPRTKIVGATWLPVSNLTEARLLVIEGSSPAILGRDVLTWNNDTPFADGEQLPWTEQNGLQYVIITCSNQATYVDQDVFKLFTRLHSRTHHSLIDIEKLLLRAGEIDAPLDDATRQCLTEQFKNCPSCFRTQLPSPNRKTSFTPAVAAFGERVAMDILYLAHSGTSKMPVLHIVDEATAYSEAVVLPSRRGTPVTEAFASAWVYSHGAPGMVKYDPEFGSTTFRAFCNRQDIQLAPIPARRHAKLGVVERKHRELRKFYMRLAEAHANAPSSLLVAQAAFLSNVAYGSKTASSFELARGYTPHLGPRGFFAPVDAELKHREEKRKARRRLQAARSSQRDYGETNMHLIPGEKVMYYFKPFEQRVGTWQDGTVINATGAGVTVSTSKDRRGDRFVALEDIRRTPLPLSPRVTDFADEPPRDQVSSDSDSEESENAFDLASRNDETNEQGDKTSAIVDNLASEYGYAFRWQSPRGIKRVTLDDSSASEGTSDEQSAKLVRRSTRRRVAPERLIETCVAITLNELQTIEMLFGGKPFSYRAAMNSGISPAVFEQALQKELAQWKDGRYEEVQRNEIPREANIIGSHVLFQCKHDDEGGLKLKARLVLWGNKEQNLESLRGDAPTPPLVAVRLLLTIAAASPHLTIAKVDIKGAYLQSGPIERDVFVKLPSYIHDNQTMWKLISKPYGLVDAGRQWLIASDTALQEINLTQSSIFPQLFRNEHVLLAKYVDDILILGPERDVHDVIRAIQNKFTVGTVDLQAFRYLGADVSPHDTGVSVSMEHYTGQLQSVPIDRNATSVAPSQLRMMLRLCGQINWLGQFVSPFAAFIASYAAQRQSSADPRSCKDVNGALKELIRVPARLEFGAMDLSSLKLVAISDAGYPFGKETAYCQAAFIIILRDNQGRSALIDWESTKCKRVVYSTMHAEMKALLKAYEQAELIRLFFHEIFGTKPCLVLQTDSKSIFEHLQTDNPPKEAYTVKDFSSLRHILLCDNVELEWIPGTSNPADPLTKRGALHTLTELVKIAGQGRLHLSRKGSVAGNPSEKPTAIGAGYTLNQDAPLLKYGSLLTP